MENKLVEKFDNYIKEHKYTNRSEAIRDIIRKSFVEEEWKEKKEITGAIVLVYNHHTRQLPSKLLDIQHNFYKFIISVQHIHLDNDNCLEILAVKGKTENIKDLFNTLKSTKGIKYCELTKATTGKEII